MNNNSRQFPTLPVLIGCLLVTLLCICLIILVATGIFFSTAATPAAPAVATLSAAGGNRGTKQPPAPTQSPEELAAIRTEIENNVVTIRGLTPLEAIEPTMLTTAELRQRVEEDLLVEYTPELAAEDSLVLSAFDFLEADFDLYNLTLDLYSEQIAGYYDPETAEFVIVGDAAFGALEQWTYAHEFAHALQDQYFALEMLSDDSLDSEALAGLQALAEGDATLVQSLYLLDGYFNQRQIVEILTTAGDVDTAVFDSAPPIIARNLEFPYLEGLSFVQYLHDQGGFAAVDEAWANPPQSTEHILHPNRYLAGDAPQLVPQTPLTETLGAGWQRLDEDIFGEFFLREYLGQQLKSADVDEAATGWGGDRYAVYWHAENEQLAMLLHLVWDTPTDAAEFNRLYPNYPTALYSSEPIIQPDGALCWQGDDVLCLADRAGESLIIRAPNLATAAAILAAVAGSA